ncbi:Chitin synthase 1 [Mizuhopecten yessoensis]|uniref:chitin synthase n=1 Tax=Mizuhopecten yessoensis TaxID=6573 RepID=A0A210R6G3_MIZYE|nr:Chitin synthase 1 [Mizuhopecten yessoensis]
MTKEDQLLFTMNYNPEIAVEQTALTRNSSQHDVTSEFTMVNIASPKEQVNMSKSPRMSVVSNQSQDSSFQLTMDEQSKVERELSKKEVLDLSPSKTVIIFKWVVTFIFGLIGLGCIVGSSLSFIEIAARLPGADNKESCSAFSTILLILFVPNVFNLLRALWNGLRRHDMPWPNKRAINWIFLTSVLESFGLCVFAFKILSLQLFGVNGLLLSTSLFFIFPIAYIIKIRQQSDNPRAVKIAGLVSIFFLVLSVFISIIGSFSFFMRNLKDIWLIPAAVLCLTIVWSPLVQKRLINVNDSNSKTDDEHNSALHDITDKGDVLVTKRPQACWKSAIILSACRMPCIVAFSLLLHFVDSDKYKNADAIDSFRDSLDWHFEHIEPRMLFTNLLCTFGGYFVSSIACRITMQRGAFVLPLLFATPVVFSILSVESACKRITSLLHPDNLHMCQHEKLMFNVPAIVCVFLALCLSLGWIIWTTNTIVLCTEAEIFWLPTFSGILLMEWLLLSRRNRLTEQREAPKCVAKKIKVYICTTMYRETRNEMKQLLKSINRIQKTYSDKYFESHVFFDGGVKDRTPTDFALQLISLLPDTLGCDVKSCTRFMTPYGMKLTWELTTGEPGLHTDLLSSRKMKFAIHLKDNRKVKNKKRWSQIMYMSYVLDYLVKHNLDSSGSNEVDDYNAFILTTDADVDFTPTSVDALLDLMICDNTVGAVCARTHPVGFGPLVWYQKFEYAIGHWFQKVQSGWRIEYCATAENWTHCPEEFEEFYKQRRRWIASTIANLMLLVQEWKKISMFNYRVSLPFLIYQALLLLSTLISPSVIILIVSGDFDWPFHLNRGLYYAWNLDGMSTIVLQCLLCVGYAMLCLYFSDNTQLQVTKLLTFLYACVMMAVAVGTAQQVVKDLENHFHGGKMDASVSTSFCLYFILFHLPDISADIQISMTSLYLGSLILFFMIAGLLHPRDFMCLLHGFWYLMCLPSGYLILNIYSVCNITDRTWGTREEKEIHSFGDVRSWYDTFGEKMKTIFFCCKKEEPSPNNDANSTSNSHRHRDTSLSETSDNSNFRELVIAESKEEKRTTKNVVSSSDREAKEQEPHLLPEPIPMTVDQWLDNDFKDEYGPLFKKHGFDNTLYISGMNEKDLKNIGIRKKAHMTFLLEIIRNLPDFRIEVKVPNNVQDWLHDIGLEQYFDRFENNKIITAKDLEVLKSFSRREIETELKITKAEELKRIEVKRDMNSIAFFEISIINPEENAFWATLRETCLQPGSAAFGHTEELMDKLGELRNNFLMTLAVSNMLWLILLATLATKLELKMYGTDPIGLLFLSIFESLFVIQFIGMVVHRAITLGHFCARAPYKFGQSYYRLSAWKLRDIKIS